MLIKIMLTGNTFLDIILLMAWNYSVILTIFDQVLS